MRTFKNKITGQILIETLEHVPLPSGYWRSYKDIYTKARYRCYGDVNKSDDNWVEINNPPIYPIGTIVADHAYRYKKVKDKEWIMVWEPQHEANRYPFASSFIEPRIGKEYTLVSKPIDCCTLHFFYKIIPNEIKPKIEYVCGIDPYKIDASDIAEVSMSQSIKKLTDVLKELRSKALSTCGISETRQGKSLHNYGISMDVVMSSEPKHLGKDFKIRDAESSTPHNTLYKVTGFNKNTKQYKISWVCSAVTGKNGECEHPETAVNCFFADGTWIEVKKPTPLFVTEDKKEVFPYQKIWFVTKYFKIGLTTASKDFTPWNELKFFSTEQAAKDYVEYNKPIYTKKDIAEALNSTAVENYNWKRKIEYFLKNKK